MVCGRQLIFMVLCINRDCLSWGYWCPWWGHWHGCGYTEGSRCLPIFPWSWFFPGTLWLYIVTWKNLTKWSGLPPLCVRIPVSLFQSKVCLTSVIWSSFERWLFFLSSTKTVFTGVSRVLPEYDSSRIIISSQMRTGQRVVTICHCVTVEFFIPFLCVQNARETWSARCRIPLSWES